MRLFNWIKWKKKANTFENKYLRELEKNEPLKEELEKTKSQLIVMYQKRIEQNKELKDLKVRVSELEKIVKK